MLNESDSILGGGEDRSVSPNDIESAPDIAVNVKICGRVYPMRVKPSDEPRIREAGKQINEQIEIYRTRFGIEDKQDLLSMVAFDCLIMSMKSKNGDPKMSENLQEEIMELTRLVEKTINS